MNWTLVAEIAVAILVAEAILSAARWTLRQTGQQQREGG